jgi:hypothetical protein
MHKSGMLLQIMLGMMLEGRHLCQFKPSTKQLPGKPCSRHMPLRLSSCLTVATLLVESSGLL